jgi:DeoR family ulaG and ulaABCDEF operon transcriptional repressor
MGLAGAHLRKLSMYNHERRRQLLKILSQRGFVAARELTTLFHISLPSARRDIVWLLEHNLARRRRGGIEALPDKPPSAWQAGASQPELPQRAARQRAIARAAAAMCASGDTVTIHGDATALLMAEFLADKQLTVLTNAFAGARALIDAGHSDVVLQGGMIDRERGIVMSPFEHDFAAYHYSSKMFTGIAGFNQEGLIEADAALQRAGQRMIGHAERLIVLADGASLRPRSGPVVCPLTAIDTLITDTGAPPEVVALLRRSGVHVMQVRLEEAPDHAWSSSGCTV